MIMIIFRDLGRLVEERRGRIGESRLYLGFCVFDVFIEEFVLIVRVCCR